MEPSPTDLSVFGTENFEGNLCLHGALQHILTKRQRDSSRLEDLPVSMLRRVTGWRPTHPTAFESHPPQQMLPAQHAQYTAVHINGCLMGPAGDKRVAAATCRRHTGKTWAGLAKLGNC